VIGVLGLHYAVGSDTGELRSGDSLPRASDPSPERA